jgi:protein transport protein SEC31
LSRTSKHSGAIKSLQFNPLKPQILATAGAKGELFIYDVNDISNPFRLGNAAARSDDLECVAWNRKVPHILATGGSGGFVTVWDLKTKKASLTLNNSRKAVSAIAWDPNNSTKLLTATPDDNSPVIFLWDLRNSNAPEKVLQGHEQGVLSLSWCQQDSSLLLSCGKDNRTLLWNPQTGERYGEFPEVTNWTFLTRFHPQNPNLSATASFDGKITVQTLQNTNPSTAQTAAQRNLDGEDFFTSAQTQPQGASFTLMKAPHWLERPVGASFGFGGKLIIFKQSSTQTGQPRSSKITISHFAVDSDIGSATEKFEELLKTGDIASICESHKSQAKTEDEKADWRVLETLVGENPRQQIIDYLGFTEEEITNGVSDSAEEEDAKESEVPVDKSKSSRLSKHFADGDGDDEDFLSNLAATKEAKTDNPFHLFSDSDTTVEKQITKVLMLGKFSKAVDICLKQGRMADAFLIANCGGQDLVDKVQTAYLAEKSGYPSYLRLLGSVITKNLWDVVYNADLADWKETMAVLCTFSDPAEFPDLCEALGDRILEQGSTKDASFCYLVGSKLEKVVSIWITDLEEAEAASIKQAGEDTSFSIHARTLQHFVEKVTVFRHVTKFQDTEQGSSSGWKLTALYDKYTEYADIIAAHGQLGIAQKYLDLLPTTYPAAELARSRVRLATQKAAPQPTTRQAASTTRSTSRAQPAGYQPPQPARAMSPASMYPVPAQNPATNPYAPSSTPYAATTPYGPGSGYQPPAIQPAYQPPSGYGAPPPSFGAPPRNTATGPPMQPASKAKNMENWNDVPLVTKPPVRKTTPSVAPITAPFPGQQNAGAPPPTSPYMGQRSGPTPPPPPPKGPAPPRVTSPLAGPPSSFHGPPRPSSSAANAYAPPTPQGGVPPSVMPQVVPRVSSPYNTPPSAPPPSNRYAPAPSAQGSFTQPPQGSVMPPPPAASRPPANPYAAPPTQGPPQSQYGGLPLYEATTSLPAAPPTGPPPRSGPPPAARQEATPPPPKVAAPPKAKHAPGDRSHIPANAQQLVEIFTRDMQRVASKAPASFAPQVKDTQKRLNILFDHLNNSELVLPGTIQQLSELADALEAKNYDFAQRIQVEIQRDKTEECGNWMVSIAPRVSQYPDLIACGTGWC